ncbi:stage II sporulation protein P [Brevibacillus ruminantium]|uniref:Stage II sporulation protein P n=1 Tax=Brevibacillus ruminantium TaxID=2950604 RepID=A0ABY4WA31_9BACL|nr:stage II sporulation protein P [Brevibacillus ruminantium]USG63903.1 stage II sporulation protein P [Brevibacillus ruminantium]
MAPLIQRQFIILSFITALLFVGTGFLAMSGNRVMIASSAVQRAASHVSSLVMLKWMGQEIPALTNTVQASSDKGANSVTGFIFQLATSIHPGDLRSLLGRELPGLMTEEDARYVVAGKGSTLADLYVEYPRLHGSSGDEAPPAASEEPVVEVLSPQVTEEGKDNKEKPAPTPTTGDRKVVYVYQSHNRESWLSETKPVGTSVDHPERNISMVGKHFGEKLNDLGIGTEINQEDIYQRLLDKGKSYPLSYAESLLSVKAAKESNRELHYFFDLHRDTAPRSETTITIKGKTYARILFVVGKRNKNYEKNEAFAKEFHQLLEQKYPGLSRGVMEKGDKTDHGEYNQSISPGSLLIEVGSKYNTLQESLLTAEAMAEVFAEYYWQAEKVAKPVGEQPAKR